MGQYFANRLDKGQTEHSFMDRTWLEVGRERLRQGLGVWVKVNGRSMVPMLDCGDMIRIEAVRVNRLRSGDVVVFETKERGLVVHRYLATCWKQGQVWIHTKGDASAGQDFPVPARLLVGRVVCVARGGRRLSLSKRRVIILNYLIAKLWPYQTGVNRLLRILRLKRLARFLIHRLIG